MTGKGLYLTCSNERGSLRSGRSLQGSVGEDWLGGGLCLFHANCDKNVCMFVTQ